MKVQKIASSSLSPVAAFFFALAGVQYLVLEAITAAAFHPAYNYAYNFISDLGNPVPGDVFAGWTVYSPLSWVMDCAFIAQGILFVAAAILVWHMIPGRARVVLLVFAIAHGVGVFLLGFFHESTAALTNGVIIVHSVGAAATIIFGNIIFIIVGIIAGRLSAATWYRVVSSALGVIGLGGFMLLQIDKHLYDTDGGIPERIAVYTIVAWEVVTGVAIFAARARSRRSSELTTDAAVVVSQ